MRLLAILSCLVLTSGPSLAGIREGATYSARNGEIALLVWEKGRMVEERYSRDAGPAYPENIYSITKTLSALGVLMEAGRGRLKLDQPLGEVIPAWSKDPRGKITIRMLLQQTSGLDPGYAALYGGKLHDKRARALSLRLHTLPGTTFRYGPSHYEVMEAVIGEKVRPSTQAWLEGSLLGPLGIELRDWRKDGQGRPYFSAGAFLTARDLLKVGHLVRKRGWQWIIPIIPGRLVGEVTEGSGANAMYGMGLWLNRQSTRPDSIERDAEEALAAGLSRSQWSASCLSKAAPPDLVAMVGSRGQRVYISSSRQLVIVRLGRSSGFRDPDFLRAFFR